MRSQLQGQLTIRGEQAMEQMNLLLLADLAALLAVLATAAGPTIRELRLLQQTTRAALQRRATTRHLRQLMTRVQPQLEATRAANLAEMIRIPQPWPLRS
jgi:hypothetical protein